MSLAFLFLDAFRLIEFFYFDKCFLTLFISHKKTPNRAFLKL